MPDKIKKSEGSNDSEKFLANLCDKTFLKMWSYPNPFKSRGDELCDLLAVFENHVFIFCDRSKKFDASKDLMVEWERWKRGAIDEQLPQTRTAKKHIINNPNKIYLDAKCTELLPIPIPTKNAIFHKIIVAKGAKDACKNFSGTDANGSLAICYEDPAETSGLNHPFFVFLDKNDPVHVFDEHNLEILLKELDTFHDFAAYLTAKEEAIKKYKKLMYCGEEDLLAHYFVSYDNSQNKYKIGVDDEDIDMVFIAEGEWNEFIKSKSYQLRLDANKPSYIWDELIQKTCQNAFDGTLAGDGIFKNKSALYEMAKESRLARRGHGNKLISDIRKFPKNLKDQQMVRHVSYMQSMYSDKGYIFLQIKYSDNIKNSEQKEEMRSVRQKMLQIACGAIKNKMPHLNKVIGIAIDAPKYNDINSEDFMLMNTEDWSDEDKRFYEEANKMTKFFELNFIKKEGRITEFPEN